MTAEIIQLPQREPSLFDDAWKLVPRSMRVRCAKLSVLRELWAKNAKAFGEQNLYNALRAYVTDADFARHGGQALDRWLKAGRYEHFVVEPTAPAEPLSTFPDPMIRRAVATRLGEGFTGSYLDPCTIDGTTLVARTGVAVDRMLEHRALFRSLGFSGIRKRETPAD